MQRSEKWRELELGMTNAGDAEDRAMAEAGA